MNMAKMQVPHNNKGHFEIHPEDMYVHWKSGYINNIEVNFK